MARTGPRDPETRNSGEDRRRRDLGSFHVSDSMIRATGLRKSFGDFEAVKGIDVEVRRGEAFGFLGPNGAGKSSTMRMIAAVSPVSGGELEILGMDPSVDGPAIRGRLGVCPQEDTLDNELNVRDNLFIYGRYFGIPRGEVNSRVDELLEFVQLTEKAKSTVEDLSGGMKRRLTIARSLINRPDLLLLDEPTTGLDLGHQVRVLELVDELRRQERLTVMSAMHDLTLAGRFSDRFVLLSGGRVVATGTRNEVLDAAVISEHFGASVQVIDEGDLGWAIVPSSLGSDHR